MEILIGTRSGKKIESHYFLYSLSRLSFIRGMAGLTMQYFGGPIVGIYSVQRTFQIPNNCLRKSWLTHDTRQTFLCWQKSNVNIITTWTVYLKIFYMNKFIMTDSWSMSLLKTTVTENNVIYKSLIINHSFHIDQSLRNCFPFTVNEIHFSPFCFA